MVHSRLSLGVIAGLLLGGALALAEVRVPPQEAMKAAVQKPQPEYTQIARQMKVSGRVEVEASITTGGSVDSVRVISGNPLLTAPTVSAVKKWKFTPFQENGAPAKALAVLAFDFK